MTKLPLTEEAFEEHVQAVAKKWKFEYDENLQMMAIAYFHSLDRTRGHYDTEELGNFLQKQKSNMMTFKIHERIDKARRIQMAEEEAKAKFTVVPTETDCGEVQSLNPQ